MTGLLEVIIVRWPLHGGGKWRVTVSQGIHTPQSHGDTMGGYTMEMGSSYMATT